jgi:hypothetical protein
MTIKMSENNRQALRKRGVTTKLIEGEEKHR